MQNPGLARRRRHLLSVPGPGGASALPVLGELAVLPSSLDARQWVAHAGLDPRQHVPGSSIEHQPRISKAGNRQTRTGTFIRLDFLRHGVTM
jgi:transposase